MRKKSEVIDFLLSFFIITACITILEGTMGLLFMPDVRFGFEAFLSPPLFGVLSAASGLVTKSKKELSMVQMAFRLFLQLLIIEGIVFGANYFFGARENFTLPLNIALAIAIAVVFVIVYFVMWLNDRQSAIRFNEQLKIFQQQKNEQTF